MVRNEDKENWILGRSATTPRIGITRIQGIMTLYTDKPISLLSFKAGICTLRVSQAKKAPNNNNRPKDRKPQCHVD